MIYLDNSATTKQYDEVTEIMVEAMKNGFGNPSSLYQLGLDAEKTIKTARSRVLKAAFGETGTGDYDLVFTSGGTEADNIRRSKTIAKAGQTDSHNCSGASGSAGMLQGTGGAGLQGGLRRSGQKLQT